MTLPPIPVEFVVGHAQTKNTEGQRKPYVDLIQRWAEHEGMEDEGLTAVRRVMNTTQIDAQHMPKEFYQTYRQGEKAEQLIKLIRKIDTKILSGEVVWTWPHVMRVMIRRGIIKDDTDKTNFGAMIEQILGSKVKKNSIRRTNHSDFSIVKKSDLVLKDQDKEIIKEITGLFLPLIKPQN